MPMLMVISYRLMSNCTLIAKICTLIAKTARLSAKTAQWVKIVLNVFYMKETFNVIYHQWY